MFQANKSRDSHASQALRRPRTPENPDAPGASSGPWGNLAEPTAIPSHNRGDVTIVMQLWPLFKSYFDGMT